MQEISLETLERLIDGESRYGSHPKHQRIFDAFAKGIRAGHLQPGQRIPSESRLCERLPVSLGTLQKAMSRLVASGLIVRQRKAGTFVADRKTQAAETYVFRFTDPETGSPLLPHVRAIRVEEDRSPGPWSEALGVRNCVRLDRLLWVDQEPPAYASVYFASRHGRDLLNMPIDELHGTSTHRLLIDKFNLPTLRFEHRIACEALSREACRYLRLPARTVGTVWDVSDYTVRDEPILFQRLQLPVGHRPLEICEKLGDEFAT